jgi:hypothetical protein
MEKGKREIRLGGGGVVVRGLFHRLAQLGRLERHWRLDSLRK